MRILGYGMFCIRFVMFSIFLDDGVEANHARLFPQ